VAPFDRLIREADRVAALTSGQRWFAQIGNGDFQPKHMEFARFLTKSDFDRRIRSADFIIAHGGIGIISDAVGLGKPLLAVPRLARLGEHVDDHQTATVDYCVERGYVLAANPDDDFTDQLPQLQRFRPQQRMSQPERVADRIGEFLQRLTE
jgi:UDP-N-acetylglucosamine transferase subunit ALG13